MPQQNYIVYKVYTDGVLLKAEDFTIQEWDKIYLPLFMYLAADTVNNNIIEIRNRLLHKTHLTIGMRNKYFTNSNLTNEVFMDWYRNQLSSITGNHIKDVSVIKCNYHWNKSNLTLTDSSIAIQTKY